MRSYFRKDYEPKFKRYTYPVNTFTGFDAKSNENNLPLSCGVYGYNVRIEGGRLKQGMGIDCAEYNGTMFPSSVYVGSRMVNAGIFRHYDYVNNQRDDIFVAQLYNKKIYYMRFSEMQYVDSGIKLKSSNVTFLNYHITDKDYFLILTDSDTSYLFDGETFVTFMPPSSISACAHGSRVYSVNPQTNKLSFSKELAPLNWTVSATEGGNITFPDEGGALTGVISWKNALYVFREFAIHRLTAYVDQSEFALSKVFSTTAKINFKTVAICNEVMYFLTDNGFYSFDGYNVKEILWKLFPLIKDPSTAHATFFDNTYYVAVTLKTDGEVVGDEGHGTHVRNGIISYEVTRGETGVFRGTDICKFVPFNIDGKSLMFLLFGSVYRGLNVGMLKDTGMLFDQPLKKVWKSPLIDFGALDKVKVLKRFFIRSDYDAAIDIVLDKSYPVDLIGTQEGKMVPVNRHAQKLGFAIRTEENMLDVHSILFELDFIRRIPNE